MIPLRWHWNSWEEKAREDPLFAIMTAPQMRSLEIKDGLPAFFAKGRTIAERFLIPALELSTADGVVVEYGCGAGRILNALVEREIPCVGVDVSPTMIDLCKRLVPRAGAFVLNDGRVPLPDQTARMVYTYAVLQHFHRLSLYERAVDEMCRLIAAGGMLVLHTNCRDSVSTDGKVRGKTYNFERLSFHFGENVPLVRPYTTWQGLSIGFNRLRGQLEKNGLDLIDVEAMPGNKMIVRARRSAAN
jgi:SAM-dependent methyltransferase